ncbi:metal-dependent hydrolase [Nocardia sp. NPDC059764]|uniref:metal-dependent hydrolase n=1 Tax=Nocardia sp. NPDC059764 TaxID=3346939 RepID=UPI00365D48DB
MANTLPAQTYPRARRIRFRFDRASSDKYFVENDMVYSHFVAGMSGGFPAGEKSFIRSVRRVADRVTDPVLKKRVTGFVGQEAMHGLEHRKLNEKLVELGYPIAWPDSPRAVERMRWIEELRPGFHPDDIDTSALLSRWQSELFGDDGQLVDHLK